MWCSCTDPNPHRPTSESPQSHRCLCKDFDIFGCDREGYRSRAEPRGPRSRRSRRLRVRPPRLQGPSRGGNIQARSAKCRELGLGGFRNESGGSRAVAWCSGASSNPRRSIFWLAKKLSVLLQGLRRLQVRLRRLWVPSRAKSSEVGSGNTRARSTKSCGFGFGCSPIEPECSHAVPWCSAASPTPPGPTPSSPSHRCLCEDLDYEFDLKRCKSRAGSRAPRSGVAPPW